jgi:hypothetical protein
VHGSGDVFTLCLVDQHLPDGRGSDFLGEMERCGAWDAAAVLITGDSASDAALTLGYPDLIVLRKPVTPLKLRSVLGVALQRARAAGNRAHEHRVRSAQPVGVIR